jgi:hypothetical protein
MWQGLFFAPFLMSSFLCRRSPHPGIKKSCNGGCDCPRADERICQEAEMVRRFFKLGAGIAGLILAMVLVMGLALPASAFAADKHGPVVTAVSPTTGSASGGNTVTITGKNFASGGKSRVKKVTFGKGTATQVHVESATLITVTAPAGKGVANVYVTTRAGTSARVSADKYTYHAPAAKYIVTSNGYAPVAGTAVIISARLASASNHPVYTSGVKVTWSKIGSGGSFSSVTSTTNANGVATVTFTTGTAAATDYAVTAADGSSRKGVSAKITTTAGLPTQIAVNAGDNQLGSAGTAVGTAPSVIVKDANNNPVSGVSVIFAVASGGGSVTGSAATTNSSGIAAAGSWTLGPIAGTNTLTATSIGLLGSPLTFTASTTIPTQIALNAGDGQSASTGAAVSAAPSVIVKNADNNPVSGVIVTFAVTAGGGSVTGSAAITNASGIATVGSWKLGTTAGANTLTATSGALNGSPVTFGATGVAGVLQVQYNGTPVRSYSLAELEALTPFAGYAGFRKSTGTIVGPDAVTGVKVTDIVADALGTPLTTAESVDVANVSASPYDKTFSYDRLVNLTGFTMYDATSKNPVAISSLTGPLVTVLIYNDPAGLVMSAASGPLRFVVADATSENVVMSPSSDSVSSTNLLNVITPEL